MSGKAADEVVAVTGKTEYNVEIVSVLLGVDSKMYGVVSEDGKKMTFKDTVGVSWMEWITEEEAATAHQQLTKLRQDKEELEEETQHPMGGTGEDERRTGQK